MTSGYVGIADGPWACYRCCVFGDTAEGWWKHGEAKHPIRIVPEPSIKIVEIEMPGVRVCVEGVR